MQLTNEESHALERIMTKISERAKYSHSIDELLGQWSGFVIEVEQGYRLTIYDYENDLDHRVTIEEILNQAPPSLKSKLEVLVHPWDKRFTEATREARKMTESNRSEQIHETLRIPKKLVGELEMDLRNEGYVER